MKSLNNITKENFSSMFDLRDILEKSVYYPAAGTDGSAIRALSHLYESFIQVDYSVPLERVKQAMENDFLPAGYELIGIQQISNKVLPKKSFIPANFELNCHEKQRLTWGFIHNLFYFKTLTPYVLWAVYELNSDCENSEGKVKRFSLLHIGGEACATFQSLYLKHKINPAAIAIIMPSEGYGDNWTVFRDTSFRFYQDILYNTVVNGAQMPNEVLYHEYVGENHPLFWPEYLYSVARRLFVFHPQEFDQSRLFSRRDNHFPFRYG